MPPGSIPPQRPACRRPACRPPAFCSPAFHPTELLLLAALLACYPLSAALPASWAREGGILESLQVLVLGAGCVAALVHYLGRRAAPSGLLALWSAPVWLLLAGRELSWGRVLFAHPEHAGAFLLEPLVRPAAVVLALWLLFSAFYFRIGAPLRTALAGGLPWLCLGVALVAAFGSTCAEGHMGCTPGIAADRAQLIEEMAELLAYVALCLIQAGVLKGADAPHRRASARICGELPSKYFQKNINLSSPANGQGER